MLFSMSIKGGKMSKRVLWWGRFDPGYSRNRVYQELFRQLGWEVDYFFVKVWPRFGDVEAFFRGLDKKPRPDLVWVPVARQRDIAAACRWAHKRGIRVIFDPMISAWDKKVLEQKKWKATEKRAKKLLALEQKLMRMPDMVCWDTSCHVDFCEEYLKVPRDRLRVLLTGTDEKVFKPQSDDAKSLDPTAAKFKVLYHGAYLPLHGTETIVEAARMTQDTGIEWDFLGWGAYKASTEAKAVGITNVRFLDKVPYTDVPKVICEHDIVLGVFGSTAKAARVIGNKVYECMACCRPTINEFCTGYPESSKTCKAIKFIPASDAKALVEAVKEYRADWSNRDLYFKEARKFFEENLSMNVIKKQFEDILNDVFARDVLPR
jgi:glycosyltransferase involved in cell wall biosynthesis